MEELAKATQMLLDRIDSLDLLRSNISSLENGLGTLQNTVTSNDGITDTLFQRADEASTQIENVKKTVVDNYAQNTEVQAMVKDVLLIW